MTRYRVNTPKVAADTVDGEVVAINFETGSYFSLTGSGARIWSALERSATCVEVVADLGVAYEIRANIEAIVAAFLEELRAEGLIVAIAEEGEATAALPAPPGERHRFEPPVLERFTDLSDLIRLDPVHEVEKDRGWPHAKPDA